MLISILLDVLDFVAISGNIVLPFSETFIDIILGIAGLILWGKPGGLQFLEVLDPTGVLDGFIPTLTIAGLLSRRRA